MTESEIDTPPKTRCGAATSETRHAAAGYTRTRIEHWDRVARDREARLGFGGLYHQRLRQIFRSLIPPGRQVLEVGCGNGDLLAAVEPGYGLGLDFSRSALAVARRRHPELDWCEADAHDFECDTTFDYVILSDLLNELWDVEAFLKNLRHVCSPQTRVIVNSYSRLWELPLKGAAKLRLARSTGQPNWLTIHDLENLLGLCGFELMRVFAEFLMPLRVPLVAGLCNRYLVKVLPFRWLALTNFLVAREQPRNPPDDFDCSVSVVIPARNEAGNIRRLLDAMPAMGSGTETIFVEGNSTDGTYEVIEKELANRPSLSCKLLRQPGKGKGDAVRTGFAAATGDVLMILDADATVAPEDLPRFYEALRSGKGELVNGVRLVYPMENRAMSFFNLLGNTFFSWAFTWLLGQPVKDTLCGTKVLWRRDYEALAAVVREEFGEFDPFGDFELLFGAAKLNLKIVDVPIRYRERTYGATNIRRWKHGGMLLVMFLHGTRRLKFV